MNNANKNIYGYSKFIIHGLKCNAFNYFIIKKKIKNVLISLMKPLTLFIIL